MKKIHLLICLSLSALLCLNTADAQINIIETVAGIASSFGSIGDGGQATLAKLNMNYLLARDAAGKIYIADNGNAKIRMFDPATGIITTVAGSATSGFSGDGSPATAAQLGAAGGSNPGVVGVAIDPGANFLYISDGTNNRIRMVTMATGIITTICGSGTAGFVGDGGPATAATCRISGPRGIAVDAAGNIYFVDNGNQRIRMITAATGIITTIAGNGTAGYVADGVAASTTAINNARGLTVDATGNVYVADQTNNRIRRIDAATNIITTVAGNGTAPGYSGDGMLATTTKLNLPTDVKFDAAGNMYIADVSNNRIRMVNASGIISTIGGSGNTGGGIAGDGGPATAAAVKTSSPVSIAVDPGGKYFFFSDRGYHVLREVRPNSIPYFTGGTRQYLSICQDDPATSINTLTAVTDTDQKQIITWSAGAWTPLHGSTVIGGTLNTNGGSVTHAADTYTPTAGYNGMDSFIVQVSDGYNTSTDTIIVTINPPPVAAAISGLTTVCEGASITLADATPAGVWANTTGNASVTGGTVNGLTAGTDTISYTVTTACGTNTAIKAITVNALPNAGTILGSTTVCTGGTTVLTDATPGGTWSASNGNATVVGGTVTGVVTGTTDDISYTVSNGCGSDITTITMNVITTLGGGTVLTGGTVFCQGATTTLTNPISGGTWSESTGNTTVVGGLVTGVAGGTDIITYALTNACGTNNITKSVTVNPLPNAGTILGLTSVCLGGTITLTNTAGGGTWSASNANATITSGGLVTGVTVGTDVISYSVINACGTTVATVTINVVSLPTAGAISGSSNVCQSASITLTDPVPGGVWSASNANATVVGGVVTGVTAGTVTISYSVTFSCGSAFAVKAMTVNPLPAPAAISGSSSVCLGGTATYTDAVAGGVWSASNANATVSGTGLVSGVTIGLDTILYSITNGCGTVTVSQPMSVDPVVTPGVSFTANPGFTTCPGTSVTYLATPVNGGLAPVYQWRVNGVVMGSTSGFIYTPINGDHVSVKLTTSLACVTAPSVADTVTVVVNPTIVPTAHITVGLTGDTLCVGDIATYTATSTGGGTLPVYQWHVNGTLYSFANPFSFVPNNGDVVTCDVTSNYACPSPATVTSNSITMTVNTTELPTVNITVTPGNPICAGQIVTFSVHSLYGGLTPFFRWTKNGVNVATGPNYLYLPSNGDDVYAMLASSATCRTMDSVFSNHIIMSTVTPHALTVVITASAGTNIMKGQDDTLTATVTGVLAPTYQWFVNGTAVAGATNSKYVVNSSIAGTEVVNCVAGSGDVCANTAVSNHLSLTFNTVAVQEINSHDMDMKLVPNPNSGVFTLQLTSGIDELVQVVVTNTVGEKVMEFITTTNKATNVKLDKAAGIYFLTASTAHTRNVAKVIVE